MLMFDYENCQCMVYIHSNCGHPSHIICGGMKELWLLSHQIDTYNSDNLDKLLYYLHLLLLLGLLVISDSQRNWVS